MTILCSTSRTRSCKAIDATQDASYILVCNFHNNTYYIVDTNVYVVIVGLILSSSNMCSLAMTAFWESTLSIFHEIFLISKKLSTQIVFSDTWIDEHFTDAEVIKENIIKTKFSRTVRFQMRMQQSHLILFFLFSSLNRYTTISHPRRKFFETIFIYTF